MMLAGSLHNLTVAYPKCLLDQMKMYPLEKLNEYSVNSPTISCLKSFLKIYREIFFKRL